MSETASYFQTRLLATRDALNSIQDLQQRQHILQGMMTELGAAIEAHTCENGCSAYSEDGKHDAENFGEKIMDALELEAEFDDEEVENQTSQVMIVDEHYYPLFPKHPKESIDLMLQFVDRTSNQKLENIFRSMFAWAIRHKLIDLTKSPDKETYASTVASIRPTDNDDDDDDREKKKK